MQININLGKHELDIFQDSDKTIYVELSENEIIEYVNETTKEQVKILVDKFQGFYDILK